MRLRNIARRITVLVLALVMVTLMVGFNLEVASGKGKFEATNAKKFKLKANSSFSGNLIEWTKVSGASKYIIYRKVGNKKNKKFSKKWKAVYSYSDGWFHSNGNSDNMKKKRWFVDVIEGYKYGKKKVKGSNIDKHSYKYYVKAVNKKNKKVAVSKTKTLKRKSYKANKNKVLPNFGLLYYINKERKKEGLRPLWWDRYFNSGSKIRAKDLDKKFEHERPNDINEELKANYGLDIKTAYFEYRFFDGAKFYDLYNFGENIAENYDLVEPKDLYSGYKGSEGHHEQYMGVTHGAMSSFFYKNHEVSSFFKESFPNTLVSTDYGGLYSKEKRKAKDKTLKLKNNSSQIKNTNLTGETQYDAQLKKAEAAELFAPMLLPDFASQYKDRDADELFNEFKNNGWLNEAISTLGETKVRELFKEFVNNDLANKTKERSEWLHKIEALLG